MADLTLTASNSVYMLAVRNLYPIPQLLEGYAADAAFDTDASEMAEVVKGVDGRMSAGFVPFMTNQTIALQADSPSMVMFETWMQTQKQNQELLYANATITLLGTQRKYTLTKGVLVSGPMIPGVRKVLQARSFRITWDDITPTPYTEV